MTWAAFRSTISAMSVRVSLVAAARSSSLLAERFDDDRPLDQAGWHEVQLAAQALVPLGAAELRYCSPTARSRATGEALGYAPMAQPALRDCDMGRWRGLTLSDVAAREPAAVDAWLADPRSAPHGGEPLLAFITRIGAGWTPAPPARVRSSPSRSFYRRPGRPRLRAGGAALDVLECRRPPALHHHAHRTAGPLEPAPRSGPPLTR